MLAWLTAFSFILVSCGSIADEEFPNGQWSCGDDVITIDGDYFWINGTKEEICRCSINVWMTGKKVDVIYSINEWDFVEGFPKRMFALDRDKEVLFDIFDIMSFGPEDVEEIPWNELRTYKKVRRDKIVEFKNEIPKEYSALKGLWANSDQQVLISDDGVRTFKRNYSDAKIAKVDVLLPCSFTIVKNKTRHESYIVFENEAYRVNGRKSLDGFEKVSDNQVDTDLFRARRDAVIHHKASGCWYSGGINSFVNIMPNEMYIHLPKYSVSCTVPYILDDEGRFVCDYPSQYYKVIAELRPNGKLKICIEEYCGEICTLYLSR